MPETIQEFVHNGGSGTLRVDRASGVLRGVKLLGLRSANGRQYRESALREASQLYEGAKVNVNHPAGSPLAPRDYRDRLGVIRSVAFRAGEGLFGDLHFNPKHALAEQLVWDAEHEPANVGLSHNVLARTSRDGEQTTVEAITRVQSVDLVADPAATRGLFEHTAQQPPGWDALSLQLLREHRPDLVAELACDLQAECELLRNQLDEATAQHAVDGRRQQIVRRLTEHRLPVPNGKANGPIVSDAFLATLLAAPDEQAVDRLIRERAELVHAAREWSTANGPKSRDQNAMYGPQIENARQFAKSLGM